MLHQPEAGVSLSETQYYILDSFYDELHDTLNKFCEVAPEEVRPMRICIIEQALKLRTECFERFLKDNYPAPDVRSPLYEQYEFFKSELLFLNQLCMLKANINGRVLMFVADKSISPSKLNNPKIKELVAQTTIEKVAEIMPSLAGYFNYGINPFVERALNNLEENEYRTPTAKRLFM